MHPARRSQYAAVLVVALAAAAPAVQAQTDTLKIGLVNVQRVMTQSRVARTALSGLEELGRQKEAEVQARAAELQDLQRRLAAGAGSMSRDEQSALEREIERKTIDAQRLQDDANRELAREQERVVQQIENRVMPMIRTLGEEMGFTLIFRKFESGLLYADESLDITDQLIQRLDASP